MFKIPDWEEDTPQSKVNFGKKVTKRKEKVQKQPELNGTHVENNTLVRNPIKRNKNGKPRPINLQQRDKPQNFKGQNNIKTDSNFTSHLKPKQNCVQPKTLPIVKITNLNAKKSPAKRKHEKNKGTKKKKEDLDSSLDIEDMDFDKPDESLVKAKKKKLNDTYLKDDQVDLLFGEGKPKKKAKVTVVQEKKKPFNQKKEKLKRLLESNRTPLNVSGNKLRERMLERLKAAQFRYLNEKLYTSSGSEAQQLFDEDPTAFQTYHQGYQQQLRKWPVNPLDVIVKKILKMPKTHVIADMGCGEAALAKRLPHPVRSFDLVATAPGVEVCDMAHTPLLAASMDVAVYCLALMGTELTQYLIEANRILKAGGQLLIAEVESRFEDVDAFARDVEKLGFKLKSLDKKSQVFFFLQFAKVRDPPKKAKPSLALKPCFYKKR